MPDIPFLDFEVKVLELFIKGSNQNALSPKDVDEQLKFGEEKVIDIFLDLEVKGFIEWVKLNLIEMDLEKSTQEIYKEVYNSNALITKKGQVLLKNYMSQTEAA